MMQVFKYILEDAMKGRGACKGIDIITETSGSLDVRMPLTDKAACGWLIMPKWFYAGTPMARDQQSTSDAKMRKYTNRLPHAATALFHRHEELVKGKIAQTARRLLEETNPSPTGTHPSPTGDGGGSGDGSGGGSGGAGPASFMASFQVDGKHYCTGALISPMHVLTTATCTGQIVSAAMSSTMENTGATVSVAGSVVPFQMIPKYNIRQYPSVDDESHDIAIVRLTTAVTDVPPVEMYDGRDLGVTDCKKMTLGYPTWNPDMAHMQLVNHIDCAHQRRNIKMAQHIPGTAEPASPVSNNEICVKRKPATAATADMTAMNAGPCRAEYGLPLIANVKDRGIQLLGLSNDDHMCKENLPAVFTRVSSYLQWIRATVGHEGFARHPALTLELSISQISVPNGFEVKVYNSVFEDISMLAGFERGKDIKDMDNLAVLDSKCQASKEEPFIATSDGGAMLIMLVPSAESSDASSTIETDCDAECVKMIGFTAKFGLGDGECIGKANDCPATKDCTMSVTWSEFRHHFEKKGKGYTGGLGKRMMKRRDREYGVWACLRDWSSEEQLKCGTQIGELACFWFEEKSKKFEFQGLNSKVRLVTPAQDKHGKDVEDEALHGRTLATWPDQAPAPATAPTPAASIYNIHQTTHIS
jgi:hypothetical protein